MKRLILKSAVVAMFGLGVQTSMAAMSLSTTTIKDTTNNAVVGTVTGWKAGSNTALIGTTTLESWGGGVGAGGEPPAPDHAVDNYNGFEALLLDYGTSLATLSSITSGYRSNDSDFFVLAYTGSGTSALAGSKFSSLDSGWTLIGNYSFNNIGSSSVSVSINAGSVASSLWLIGTGGFTAGTGINSGDYRKGAAVELGTCSGTKNTVCGKYDYIKFASVGGKVETPVPPSSVPEPGSLALAGLALVGMMGLRRRKQA